MVALIKERSARIRDSMQGAFSLTVGISDP